MRELEGYLAPPAANCFGAQQMLKAVLVKHYSVHFNDANDNNNNLSEDFSGFITPSVIHVMLKKEGGCLECSSRQESPGVKF